MLFTILQQAPGGPLTPYLQNPHITQADIERLKHNLGLDQPVYVQYFKWLGRVMVGDFGWSQSNSEPVTQAIIERLPATLELMGASFVLSLAIGVTAGIISAVKQYSWIDYLVTDVRVLRPVDAGVLVRADAAAALRGLRHSAGLRLQDPAPVGRASRRATRFMLADRLST